MLNLYRQAIVVFVGVYLVAILTMQATKNTSHLEIKVIVFLLIISILFPYFRSLLETGRLDILNPSFFFSISIFLGHVLPLSNFLAGVDSYSRAWPYEYNSRDSSLLGALVIAIIGVNALYLGYYLGGKSSQEERAVKITFQVHWQRERIYYLGILYTALGIGLFIVGVTILGGFLQLIVGLNDRIRTFTGLNYFFTALLLLPTFAFIWWNYLLSIGKPKSIAFWVYSIFSILLSGLLGSRANTFIFILACILAYNLVYKQIKARFLLVLAILALIVLPIFSLYFREYAILGELTSIDISQDGGELLYQIVENGLAGDFYQIQALATIVDSMPETIPFQYGKTYLFFLISPVPSSLWPGKLDFALPSTGVYTLGLWPNRWLDTGTTVPPSLMGEMYMNFGNLGVFLGMLIVGYLYKRIKVLVQEKTYNPYLVLIYCFTVAIIPHYVRGEFSAPTILLLTVCVPGLLGIRFVTNIVNQSTVER